MARKKRMRFKTWCAEDVNDKRKINYICQIGDEEMHFTSEDTEPFWIMEWLRNEAMVDDVQLIDDEWFVELSERR